MRLIKVAKILGVALLFAPVGSIGARADLVTDGGFDNPTNPQTPATFGFYANYGAPNSDTHYAGAAFDGSWTITGNVDLVETVPSGWLPQTTPYSLDLVGNAPGAISQSLTTVANQKYTLSFYYSNNSYGAPNPALATVSVGSLSDTISHGGASPNNMNWVHYVGTFTASSGSTLLTFAADDGLNGCCNGGIALDSISVTAIPEPATWAMMILGFLGIGFMAYRRNSAGSLRIA